MKDAATLGPSATSEVEQLRARLIELEQSVARAARELAALHEISLEIDKQTDLTTLLQTIVEKAAGLLNAHMGGLYVVHPENEALELVVSHNLPGQWVGTILSRGEGLSGRVAQTGQVLVVSDYQAWEGQAAVYAGAPFRRVVGVPLKIGEKVIGVINITDDRQTGEFDDDEVRLVTLFAEQAAIAMERARLLAEVQRDLAELQRAAQVQSSLYRISEAAHTAQSLDDLYRSIHLIIGELMPARNFAIALYDVVTEQFIFPYRVDEHYPGELTPPPRPLGKTLVDYVWHTGQPLLASTEQMEQLVAEQHLQPIGVMALDWLGVPLKWQSKTIGVMVVQTYSAEERLVQEHRQLLMFVSTQVAMAIQRKRAEQMQQSMYRISEAAHQAHSLDDLYRLVHQIVNELMPARNFGIALYDVPTDMIRFPYFIDEDYPQSAPLPRRRGSGLIEYVLRTGKPLLGVQDELNALIERERLQPVGNPSQSWLGVPLQAQDRSIGVIVVQTYQPGERLTEEHKQILTFVSTQVMAAIQRKRAEQVQQAIYHISEAAQAAASLDELYRSIHAIVNELMPARNFYIALYDEATDLIYFPYLVDKLDDSAPVQRPGKGLTAYVLRTGQPLFAPPEVFDDMVRRGEVELIGGPSVDWLGVPLKVQDRTIGVLVVQTYSTDIRLTEEHKDILVFVSSQIAMAIQRKEAEAALRSSEQRYHDLFEAAQRQTQELTVLDRVRTTVTRELDLSELFRTVVTAIAETFGYTLVSLYMLNGQTLRLQHQVGYDLTLPDIPLASGITGRVARTGQPVLVEDVFSDPAFLAAMDDIISEIAVPLFDAGRAVGVLNIESTRGFRLTQADLRLMIALSEHISSAISRARLYTEARESAARLRTAIENLPFDFWALDKDGRYVLQNSTSVRNWGDRLGRRVSELQIDPAIAAVWEQKDRRAFAGEVVATDSAYIFNGEKHFFHEISGPIRDGDQIQGILGVNIDVTDRRQAEEKLRASEARLRAVTTNIPVILFALDQNGRLVFIEGKGLEVLGLGAEPLVGRSIFEVLPRTPRALEAVQLALAGEPLNIVLEINELIFEFWLSPLKANDGDLSGAIGVAVDMTERRRTEEALRRAQKMESLGILAGGIAHDFNNLLVAILGQASLALSQLGADSPARVPIEKAVTASRRAADLTRQLLAYSGRGQFERRPIELNHLIQENLHLFEVAVPKNVTLRSDLVEPLPLIVGDAGQLQQVIMNLIINAAEAIGDRAGQVIVRTQREFFTGEETVRWQIGDEALSPGEYVRLIIQDNGQGMDAETLSRIFDPFFSTKFTGRGLGLAAVLGIVRGHGGGLKVVSEQKVGTTFEIVLPAGTIEPVGPVNHEVLQEVDMTQHLILVIDDEEPVRDAVADILEMEGLAVIAAPDGYTGIDVYRQRQAEISLILLDLSMPGLNGEETFHELRQINSRVRVLLSSGYSHDEVTARFAGQSDVGFIQKPYDARQLVRDVKRHLALSAAG